MRGGGDSHTDRTDVGEELGEVRERARSNFGGYLTRAFGRGIEHADELSPVLGGKVTGMMSAESADPDDSDRHAIHAGTPRWEEETNARK